LSTGKLKAIKFKELLIICKGIGAQTVFLQRENEVILIVIPAIEMIPDSL
jgi:hypothetical protein